MKETLVTDKGSVEQHLRRHARCDSFSENMKRQDPCANLLAGGVGGLASLVIGHPFDTVKVRLQTMRTDRMGGTQSYLNARDCLRKIIRHEGVGTLFKGMSALAYSSVPRY